MKAVFAYITTSSADEARRIANTVVADRLTACANIIPGMSSIYHWEGKIIESSETIVIFKTRDELFPALKNRIRELHSYKTPCIAALSVEDMNAPFLQWILDETKP